MSETEEPIDGVLEFLRGRRNHLLQLVPKLQSGRFKTYENHQDTTEQTLSRWHAELQEIDSLLSKHEPEQASEGFMVSGKDPS